jgi:hypothetical protein
LSEVWLLNFLRAYHNIVQLLTCWPWMSKNGLQKTWSK